MACLFFSFLDVLNFLFLSDCTGKNLQYNAEVVKEVVKADIPVLSLMLGGWNFQSFTTKYSVSCGFFVNALYQVERFPYIPSLPRGFLFKSGMDIRFCQMFFCIYCNNHMGFGGRLLTWWTALTYFLMLRQCCIPEINSTWLWYLFKYIVGFDLIKSCLKFLHLLNFHFWLFPQICLPTKHFFSVWLTPPVHIL